MNNKFEDNMALVTDIYNKRFTHLSWLKDDLIQCGYMGLFKACQTFKESKGYKFSTYAGKCIINSMLMFLRKENKHINNDINFDISFEEGEDVSIFDIINKTEYDFGNSLDFQNFIEYSKNKKILQLYIQGYTLKEISLQLNLSRTCISRKIKKELQNYKNYINQ